MTKTIVCLIVLFISTGFVSSVRAQEASEAGSLGYFVGYNIALLELDNGAAFCVSKAALGALAEVIRKNGSDIDPDRPAKGIARVLADAYPCEGKGFEPPSFSSAEIAQALLQEQITEQIANDKQFTLRYSIGTIVAVFDLREGKSFCMAGSQNKISDVLEAHQRTHPDKPFSASFILDAYKVGFPCEH